MNIHPSARVLSAMLALGFVMTGAAEAQVPNDCTMAGTSVRVQVEAGGKARQTFTYVVINDRRERLHSVRIGSGGRWNTEVVTNQQPQIATAPEQWRGVVVYPADTNQFYLSWQATTESSALAPKTRTAFGIDVPWPGARPRPIGPDGQPVKTISFEYQPFTVYSDSGCWWGWTSSVHAGTPVGGNIASMIGASVRSFAQGRDYVIVDAPTLDTQIRLSGKQVFLTVPLALSWGVKGGFSHNASIGIGLRWSPVDHVSVYAQTHVGTFLFTNRTHLRHVGADVNIPRYSVSSMGSVTRDKYLVMGVEYFDRRVVRWAGYMDGPQWYASGRGLAVRFGVRGVGWSP